MVRPDEGEEGRAEPRRRGRGRARARTSTRPPPASTPSRKGVTWVGYDSNSSKFAPKSWLTAAVYNWGPYYLKRVKAGMAGTWKSGFYYGTINDGFTGLAKYGPSVSASDEGEDREVQEEDRSGNYYEFTGPLYDQKGKLRVKKGVRMQVLKGGTNSLYGMNWLVKGVIGSPRARRL